MVDSEVSAEATGAVASAADAAVETATPRDRGNSISGAEAVRRVLGGMGVLR